MRNREEDIKDQPRTVPLRLMGRTHSHEALPGPDYFDEAKC